MVARLDLEGGDIKPTSPIVHQSSCFTFLHWSQVTALFEVAFKLTRKREMQLREQKYWQPLDEELNGRNREKH